MVDFRVESWAQFGPDAEAIFPLHWRDLGLDKEHIKPDCDHERYLKMDDAGLLHVVTVRDSGRLVGYAVCFLISHMHYKSAGPMALADMYYVLPEYRKGGLGVRLFREMERGLKERGVVRIHMSCKVHEDHELLFARLGYKFTDKTFSKYVGKV